MEKNVHDPSIKALDELSRYVQEIVLSPVPGCTRFCVTIDCKILMSVYGLWDLALSN